jgi:hypothetical protein
LFHAVSFDEARAAVSTRHGLSEKPILASAGRQRPVAACIEENIAEGSAMGNAGQDGDARSVQAVGGLRQTRTKRMPGSPTRIETRSGLVKTSG